KRDRRAYDGGWDMGKPEAAARHAHDASSERDHSAHRAKEATDEYTLAAVPGEKPDAAGQQLWIAGERPDPGNSTAETVAYPERDRVAENRPDDCPAQNREIRQPPGP